MSTTQRTSTSGRKEDDENYYEEILHQMSNPFGFTNNNNLTATTTNATGLPSVSTPISTPTVSTPIVSTPISGGPGIPSSANNWDSFLNNILVNNGQSSVSTPVHTPVQTPIYYPPIYQEPQQQHGTTTTSSSVQTPIHSTPLSKTPLQTTPVTPIHSTPLHTPIHTPLHTPHYTQTMAPVTPFAGVGVGGTNDILPPNILPIIQNVVATCNLGVPLKLKEISMNARNAEYNPKRFAAVIMRIREPKTTALIFASGKMVVTGAKSEQESRLASRKYARIIQKLGYPNAKFTEFAIQNIVGSCDVGFQIRLERLSFEHQEFSNYEPEVFPGLIYRMYDPKIVLLIFVSGKIVLTGAKERGQIYTAFEKIYPILKDFRVENFQPPQQVAPQQ